MLNSRVELAPMTSATSKPTSVGRAIEELLRALAASRRPGSATKDPLEAGLTTWQDEEYYYLESIVDNTEIAFCDINIMEGKVFIRIAAEDGADDPTEFLPRLATIVPTDAPVLVPIQA